MFEAKPNVNNNVDLRVFATEDEAVKYLNVTTGYVMLAVDWRMLRKLTKI